MAGIGIGAADQYFILIAVTLFFTVLALAKNSVSLKILATVMWVFCSVTSSIYGMVIFAWLWLGVAVILSLYVFLSIFRLLQDHRQKDDSWLPELE